MYDQLNTQVLPEKSEHRRPNLIKDPFTEELSQVAKSPPLGLYASKDSNSTLFEQGNYHLPELEPAPNEDILFADDRAAGLEIGEKLIIKESWPFENRRDIEWGAFLTCTGKFGLPEVIFKITGRHPLSSPSIKTRRIPTQIAMKEMGVRLDKAESPRALMSALLHCVVGHSILLDQGWLHRDISIGNVLLLANPVTRTPPSGLHKSLDHQSQCKGILIDGDSMISVTALRESGGQRSCTLPFLSARLLLAWNEQKDVFDQYYDDLQSFAWVLFVTSIEIARKEGRDTDKDRAWMRSLTSSNLREVETAKYSIPTQLAMLDNAISNGTRKPLDTSLPEPFVRILNEWFQLTNYCVPSGGDERTLQSDSSSTEFYKKFIAIALDKMDSVPDTWS